MNDNARTQAEPWQVLARQEFRQDINLHEILDILLGAKWLIAGITAVVLCLALLYAILATPIYSANVLLQVNENNAAYRPGPIGKLAASLSDQGPPAGSEIAIMRSRYVVGQAVDKLGLTVIASPNYLPLIGRFMARRYDSMMRHDDSEALAQPWLGLASYAWGGEQIQVARLGVPQDLLGQPLMLVAGARGSYTLYGPQGGKLLTGQTGQLAYTTAFSGRAIEGEGAPADSARTSTPTRDEPAISLFVSQLKARAGTHFTLSRQPRAEVIESVQSRLSISETGVGTNIVSMRLEGPRPHQLARILDALAAIYIQQNVSSNTQQARESLQFLKTQLPKVKAKLHSAQTVLSEYKIQHQALDIPVTSKALLEQMVNVQQQLSALKLKEAEMSGWIYSANPHLQTVREKIDRMQQTKARLESRMKEIPHAQQAIFRLQRDVQVASALYVSLLEQAQELRIAQAGIVGDARIIDQALVPTDPIKPRKLLIAAFGLMLGFLSGIAVVFLRRAMSHSIDDPRALEQEFNLPVSAIVPRSTELIKARRSAIRHHRPYPILAQAAPQAPAIERLRSLRTHLQYALTDAPNNIIALSGPTSSTGKSFVIVNLAELMARSGKRVLLIDGDMRRGHLHRYFGANREPGLSQVLSGEIDIGTAIHRNPSGADILFGGRASQWPSELLMQDRFAEMIDIVSGLYDIVLIDTPPFLAVTDGAIIAGQAGINFVVLRAGYHQEQDIKLMLRNFEQSRIRVHGVIFNDLAGAAAGYQYEY